MGDRELIHEPGGFGGGWYWWASHCSACGWRAEGAGSWWRWIRFRLHRCGEHPTRVRRRCIERGHRWLGDVDGFALPVQPCRRFGCKAERPDPTLPEDFQTAMRAVMRGERFDGKAL